MISLPSFNFDHDLPLPPLYLFGIEDIEGSDVGIRIRISIFANLLNSTGTASQWQLPPSPMAPLKPLNGLFLPIIFLITSSTYQLEWREHISIIRMSAFRLSLLQDL